jgi:hypothetical protein
MASELGIRPRPGDGERTYDPASNTDWKAKYTEVADILADTRSELEQFQTTSKELEEELEIELQRTEAEKERLRVRASKAEVECEEWKAGLCLADACYPYSLSRANTSNYRRCTTPRPTLCKRISISCARTIMLSRFQCVS